MATDDFTYLTQAEEFFPWYAPLYYDWDNKYAGGLVSWKQEENKLYMDMNEVHFITLLMAVHVGRNHSRTVKIKVIIRVPMFNDTR